MARAPLCNDVIFQKRAYATSGASFGEGANTSSIVVFSCKLKTEQICCFHVFTRGAQTEPSIAADPHRLSLPVGVNRIDGDAASRRIPAPASKAPSRRGRFRQSRLMLSPRARPRPHRKEIKGNHIAARFVLDHIKDDNLRLYAVTRCLEIISEASRRLPQELKARHPSIEWREMAAAGNIDMNMRT